MAGTRRGSSIVATSWVLISFALLALIPLVALANPDRLLIMLLSGLLFAVLVTIGVFVSVLYALTGPAPVRKPKTKEPEVEYEILFEASPTPAPVKIDEIPIVETPRDNISNYQPQDGDWPRRPVRNANRDVIGYVGPKPDRKTNKFVQGANAPLVREILESKPHKQEKIPEVYAKIAGRSPQPSGSSKGSCGGCGVGLYAPQVRPVQLKCPDCGRMSLLR